MKKVGNYYVYFYYDNKEQLLYVGLSEDVGKRFNNHYEVWKKDVAQIGIRHYPNKTTMKIYEKYYIVKLKPKYNIKDMSEDVFDIDFPDPYQFEMLYTDEFVDKYCRKEKNTSNNEKLPFREKLKKEGFKIIRANKINLFDKDIPNLEETAFEYKNYVIYFSKYPTQAKQKGLAYSLNKKIEKIKAIFYKGSSPTFEDSSLFFTINILGEVLDTCYRIVDSLTLDENRENIIQINILKHPFVNQNNDYFIVDFKELIKHSKKG